jgi:FkbM family methyltransferase
VSDLDELRALEGALTGALEDLRTWLHQTADRATALEGGVAGLQQWNHHLQERLEGLERNVLPAAGPIERLRRLTPIAASLNPPILLFHTADQWIGPSVWSSSSWEEDELVWVLEFLGNPQRDGTVIDVGANIGTTTISLLARHGARRVVAFEPEPRNLRLLRCNLILNDLEERAAARGLAVTNAEGEVTLALAPENLGDHRVRTQHSPAEQTVSVPGARLTDALTPEEIEDVSVVWVDTQGHEGHVLAGASALLARRVPWVIEYWPRALREAGGYDLLHALVREHFLEAIDIRRSIREGSPIRLPAAQIDEVDSGLLGSDGDPEHFTDLLLI